MNRYSVFDAHCDTLCRICDCGGNMTKNTYNIDITRMRKYIAYTQIYAMYIAPEYYDNPQKRMMDLYNAYTDSDFTGITPILSLEGGEVIESFDAVDMLAAMGVRCVNLTWNSTNRLAGGCDDTLSGVTPFGKDVIHRLNNNGIMIDVSHLNDKSFYDVAELSALPLIATHSNSRVICNHNRNITDDMFNIIKDSGGCIGINLYRPFVTKNKLCRIGDVIKHIEHFLELGGEDHIGIGADFDGVDNNLPDSINGCEDLYKLFDKMCNLGYSDSIIDKITHKNFQRLFTEDK